LISESTKRFFAHRNKVDLLIRTRPNFLDYNIIERIRIINERVFSGFAKTLSCSQWVVVTALFDPRSLFNFTLMLFQDLNAPSSSISNATNLSADSLMLIAADGFIQQAQAIVLFHLAESDFGVSELCTALHLSPSQVYRKISAQTGQSPSIFIRHLRLAAAYDLVTQTDLSISEIAYQVGFSDAAYFARVFKRRFGQSATQVRWDAR